MKQKMFQKGLSFVVMMINKELEEWRTIEDFPRYMISSYGRVKSYIGKEKILKQNIIQGYQVVKLSKRPKEQGKYIQKCFKVHRLVAKYFCDGYTNDKHVHHLDRQRNNNYYKNLLCVTKAEHAAIHKQLKIEEEKKAAAESAAALNFAIKGENN